MIMEDRTPRERAMVFGAAALIAIFVIWQFALKPVLTAKETAARNQSAAIRDYVIVRDGVSAISNNATRSAGAPFDRTAVLSTARAINLSLSRLQPDSNGAIRIWLDDSQSTKVFAFLNTLTTDYAAQISRVQISRNDDGTVSAQITVQAAS